ncbi:sugar ABC transporter ATP-binding protein [Kineothrix sedimenti]|uniref:Sugar ABC transporter ATP-binding protein n=1 Tax=Kineothrix sedimenti TaxID=3123317 RepID=A0ABZ3EU85_9FIRM
MENKEKQVFFETQKLYKKFGEVTAVNEVSMSLHLGEIRGLIGENGSGKSTISSIISAICPVTSGEMYLFGEAYRPKDPGDARNHGISMIVQETGTIDTLSVAENIFLGDEKRFLHRGIIDRKRMIAEAKKAMENIGVTDVDVTQTIVRYSFETRKLVEVAKALYYDPTLFIIDETTTALSQNGRDIIYRIMKEQKEQGKTVLFISHDLQELMDHCDALTVLRDGIIVDTIEKAGFDENRIKHSMVGRELKGDYYRSDYDPAHEAQVMLKVSHATNEDIKDVSLKLHRGEIVGIAGLSGCGMHQLGRVIFGLDRLTEGQIQAVKEESEEMIPIRSVADALRNRIGYVSKDRDKEALVLPASIKDNLVLPALSQWDKIITPRSERKYAHQQIDSLAIKCSSMNQSVGELSGGNKQKVSFGKWIGNKSKIIVMDSPTRGVDIGVKNTMYQLIYKMKKEGYAILIISEEMPELIGMCDSILVMKDGEVKKRFDRSRELSESQIIEYMI